MNTLYLPLLLDRVTAIKGENRTKLGHKSLISGTEGPSVEMYIRTENFIMFNGQGGPGPLDWLLHLTADSVNSPMSVYVNIYLG